MGEADAPRISVALATHEGERFIGEQLDSIAGQTTPPHEVVISDDGSTDGTLDVADAFAARVPFEVTVLRNATRAGVSGNYARAIGACQGDIVFLSDDDNVWHPEKIERSVAAMRAVPGAGLVFSDGEVVDEQLRPVGSSVWRMEGWRAWEIERIRTGRGFETLVNRPAVGALLLGFSSSFKDLILPIPRAWCDSMWAPDIWIVLLVTALAPAVPVPHRSVRYRLHGHQYAGAAPLHLAARIGRATRSYAPANRKRAQNYRLIADRLREHAPDRAAGRVALLDAKIDHLLARARVAEGPDRLRTLLREIGDGRYHRFSRGWRSVLKDLLARKRHSVEDLL